jgi:hypothetical protein
MKYRIIIIGSLIFIPLFLWFLSFFSPSPPSPFNNTPNVPTVTPLPKFLTIASLSPENDQLNVSQSESIVITFASKLPTKPITLQFTPSLTGEQIINEKERRITFIPAIGLQSNTTYTASLTISGELFKTLENAQVNSYSWSFTTGTQEGETGFSEQDKEEYMKQHELAQQAYEERKRRLPFIVFLPYKSSHFRVEIATTDKVTITTFGSSPAQHMQYREEAGSWIRSAGGNPDQLNITFIPINL